MLKYHVHVSPDDYTTIVGTKCSCGQLLGCDTWSGNLWMTKPTIYEAFCLNCEETRIRKCICGLNYHKDLPDNLTLKDVRFRTEWDITLPGILGYSKHLLCPGCYASLAKQCPDCHNIYYAYYGENCVYCDKTKETFVCSQCNNTLDRRERNHYEEEPTCIRCVPVYRMFPLNAYPRVMPLISGDAQEHPLLIGLEIEVTVDDGVDQDAIVHRLWQRTNGATTPYYFKAHRVLDNGFELCFQPMDWGSITAYDWSWTYQLEDVRCKYDRTQNFRIYLSKSSFTRLHMYKFANFIYNTQTLHAFIAERFPADDKTKRNSLVNTSHETTIEICGFYANTSKTSFWKKLEYAHALYYYTKEHEIAYVSEDGFLEYVKQNKTRYQNLIMYIADYPNYKRKHEM